jgi:hypothetical protein
VGRYYKCNIAASRLATADANYGACLRLVLAPR